MVSCDWEAGTGWVWGHKSGDWVGTEERKRGRVGLGEKRWGWVGTEIWGGDLVKMRTKCFIVSSSTASTLGVLLSLRVG